MIGRPDFREGEIRWWPLEPLLCTGCYRDGRRIPGESRWKSIRLALKCRWTA